MQLQGKGWHPLVRCSSDHRAQPSRFPEGDSGLRHSGPSPSTLHREQGQLDAMTPLISPGIRPGGPPQERHPEAIHDGINPLGALQQHSQSTPGCG